MSESGKAATFDLAGKKALVTGAARGIGAAIAMELAKNGADVAITFKSSQRQADDLVNAITKLGRQAFAIRADSGDAEAVTRSVNEAVTKFGRLDILVNNAGVLHYGRLEDMLVDTIDEIIDVNIRSSVLATRAAIPHIPNGGRIIFIGSCLAERVSLTDVAIYSMSKSALLSLTRGLSRDLGPRNITVNLVHPGPTDTDMNPADGKGADGLRAQMALGRFGSAGDVATAVAYLASPSARHITGTGLVIDGGLNA
ncbi:SDR family oxidoreductase [Caballeronia sp. LjRoot31]|uniref:SDR family oxidoreductase n=1 Tax=Caballeronia sp. LjRoot31 TaxID=3342324 RepID=UPI003ECED5E7